jgi:hypothetical protein
MQFVKRIKSNGQWLMNKQCFCCGEHDSFAYKISLVKDIEMLHWFSNELKSLYHERKQLNKHRLIIERDKKIEEIKNHYHSEYWKNIRKEIIELNCGYCEICGESGNDVHHTHYDNFGKEKIEDLQLLCRSCHEFAHEVFPELGIIKHIYKDYEDRIAKLSNRNI